MNNLKHKLPEPLGIASSWRLLAPAFFICSTFDILVMEHFLAGHAPLSDDLSMIAFSNTWSWDWLTKGLADYFIVYPEYYEPQSNFIRPISNLAYWIFGSAIAFDAPFFANRIQLITLNIGTHAAICSILFLTIRRLSLSWLAATLGFIAAVFIPTFWTTPTPTYSSFVFDELAVLFCLVALLSSSARHYLKMSTCLGLALLTKEIALPIVAAFGFAFLINRQWKAVVGCGLATAIWASLRIYGFGFHTEGVYIFLNESTSMTTLILEKLKNIFTLPFGPVFYDDIFVNSRIQYASPSTLLLLNNLAVFIALIFIFVRSNWIDKVGFWIATYGVEAKFDGRQNVLFIASLTAVFSFMFDAYVGANYRYAFNFLPFLFIAIAGCTSFPQLQRMLFLLCAIGSIIASTPSISRLQSGFEFESFRYSSIRKLFASLRAHQERQRIIILNDFVLGFANPKAVEVLVPFSGAIMRGSSLYLDGCQLADTKKINTTVTPSPYGFSVTTNLPTCGQFAFESSPKILSFISENRITRNDLISYEFVPNSNASTSPSSGVQWDRRNLTAIVKNSDFLYFDFEQNDWIFVKAFEQPKRDEKILN